MQSKILCDKIYFKPAAHSELKIIIPRNQTNSDSIADHGPKGSTVDVDVELYRSFDLP